MKLLNVFNKNVWVLCKNNLYTSVEETDKVGYAAPTLTFPIFNIIICTSLFVVWWVGGD